MYPRTVGRTNSASSHVVCCSVYPSRSQTVDIDDYTKLTTTTLYSWARVVVEKTVSPRSSIVPRVWCYACTSSGSGTGGEIALFETCNPPPRPPRSGGPQCLQHIRRFMFYQIHPSWGLGPIRSKTITQVRDRKPAGTESGRM